MNLLQGNIEKIRLNERVVVLMGASLGFLIGWLVAYIQELGGEEAFVKGMVGCALGSIVSMSFIRFLNRLLLKTNNKVKK